MEAIYLLRWPNTEARTWLNMIVSSLDLRKYYDTIYAHRGILDRCLSKENFCSFGECVNE